ncbi:hypothetical protein QJS10_CPA09g00011 [Acorus calamus]|uniref:Uncharacterized protein n=1 Tax=Acorus calamus TaxID=4465 RepID=A0AAV9E425_ACOCL|nr:hypothetical protein QJS10_CPA09g00011 [Acorus calamus]
MRARLVVFPIKGRNWCFTRSSYRAFSEPESSQSVNPTLKDLWRKIRSHDGKSSGEGKVETVVDFTADKMNRAFINLGKAPTGSVKNRIHNLGLRLMSKVNPSESFLKSISKDITEVDITYPLSLNNRLVRRRLRHIAMRGSILHKKYLYGSVSLLPLTSIFSVLPLPNIPFFWILFRSYSHWRALQGSERLLLLVSDCSKSWRSLNGNGVKDEPSHDDSKHCPGPPWVLQPSKELKEILSDQDIKDGVSESAISSICETYDLDKCEVLKYRDSL